MADQVQEVSAPEAQAPAAPVLQAEQVQAAAEGTSLSSAHFINGVNLAEYIKPETLAFALSSELDEQDRILKATLDSRTLATLHVKKLILGGKVGHVFKFQTGKPFQVVIADPCVFLPLDGNFMVQVSQELPIFVMDPGKGVLLNEGADLQVWPQFKPEQHGFLQPVNISHGALIELESLNVVRPKRQATVDVEGAGEHNPKEPRAIYTYAQRHMAIFMLQMKMDPEWVAKETGPKCTAQQVLKWKETYDKQRAVREQLEKLLTEAADGRHRYRAPAPAPFVAADPIYGLIAVYAAQFQPPQVPAQPEFVPAQADPLHDVPAPADANVAVLLPVPADAAEHEPEEIVADVDDNMGEENTDEDLYD